MNMNDYLRKRKRMAWRTKLGALVLSALVAGTFFINDSSAQARLVIGDNMVINVNGGTSSNPSYLVINNPNANGITTIGSGHIHSEGEFNIVRWNIANGTGAYIVPFGDDSGDKLPITMTIGVAGSSEGRMDFSTYPTGNDNLPFPSGVSSIAHQNDPDNLIAQGVKTYNRFWMTNASYATMPEGDMSFAYKASGMTGDLEYGTTTMAAQYHDGTNWSLDQFGSDNMTGLITGVPFTGAAFGGSWTLVESGAPLPITLLSFNAVWADSRQTEARVFWSTASELNNNYFDVQRSADGTNWQNIGRVQGAGTSIHTLHYEMLDKNPLSGMAYYRLKQVDFDGTTAYTHIVALKREINGAAIAVYPNPATNQFQVAFEGFQSENVNINILDNSGRRVLTKSNNVINNPVQIINASDFQSGVYYIHVTSETESFIEKIVIAD